MNKSLLTNVLSLIILTIGVVYDNTLILYIGLFSLSGAITNWLAIYMLFEKVPGLYGSGVIPARFEDFKNGIRNLMMQQFFTKENIDRFLSDSSNQTDHFQFTPVIKKIDLSESFDALVKVIMESSFGSMLGMFGGEAALQPLKEPFMEKMKDSLVAITERESFRDLLREEIEQPDVLEDLRTKISDIIEKRLDELTPQLVKQIIQDMIQQHLGWLVIWGGVFGGLIGAVSAQLI